MSSEQSAVSSHRLLLTAHCLLPPLKNQNGFEVPVKPHYWHRVISRILPLLVLCLALLTAHVRAQFAITEFMANNVADIIDEDGNHEDWIEIYNSSLAAASLQGWYLTDDAGQLRETPRPWPCTHRGFP